MSEQNLQGRHRWRWKRTTVADPEVKIAAEDLIGRHFQPAELDVCSAGAITYAGALLVATLLHVVTGRFTASRLATISSRVLALLVFAGTLAIFWLGVQAAA